MDPPEEEVREANQSTMAFLRERPEWLPVWQKATTTKPTKRIVGRYIATRCSELKDIASQPRALLSLRAQSILLHGCTLIFDKEMKELCRDFKYLLDKMGPLNKMTLSEKDNTKSVTLPDVLLSSQQSQIPPLDPSDLALILDITILEPVDAEDKHCVTDESLISLPDDPPRLPSFNDVDPGERFGDEDTGGFKGIEELEHPELFDTASSGDQSMNGMTHDDTSLFNYNYKPATEYLTGVKKYLTDGSKISTLDGSDLQKSAKTGGFVMAVPHTFQPGAETEEEAERRRDRYRIKSSSGNTPHAVLKQDGAGVIIKRSARSKFDQFVLEPIDTEKLAGCPKRRKKVVPAVDIIKEIPAEEYERDDKPLYLRDPEPLIKKMTCKELFQRPAFELMVLPHFRVIWDKLINPPKVLKSSKKTKQSPSIIVDKSVELRRRITETISIDGPSGVSLQSHLSGGESVMYNVKKPHMEGGPCTGGLPPIPDDEESSIDHIDASHDYELSSSSSGFNCPFENKIRKRLREEDDCCFQDLVPVSTPRDKAASEFMDMLTLLNDGIISAKQLKGSYEPISLSKGRHF